LPLARAFCSLDLDCCRAASLPPAASTEHAPAICRFLVAEVFGQRFSFSLAFFANGQTAIDNSPRINAAPANCFGPSGPHLVVMKTRVWSGTRSKKPVRAKNITA